MGPISLCDTVDSSDVLHSVSVRVDHVKLDAPQDSLVGRAISLFPRPCSQHAAGQRAAEQRL